MTYNINDIVELPSGQIGCVKSIGANTIWVKINGELKFFKPFQLKKPKTIKSFVGNDVTIKAFQQSLHNYPLNLRAIMDDHGNTALTGAAFHDHKCGCKIIGNGSLQFPLTIKFCNKHK